MTKKDYKIIAKVLRMAFKVAPSTHAASVHYLLEAFSAELKSDNPLFDKTRFKSAIYGDPA